MAGPQPRSALGRSCSVRPGGGAFGHLRPRKVGTRIRARWGDGRVTRGQDRNPPGPGTAAKLSEPQSPQTKTRAPTPPCPGGTKQAGVEGRRAGRLVTPWAAAPALGPELRTPGSAGGAGDTWPPGWAEPWPRGRAWPAGPPQTCGVPTEACWREHGAAGGGPGWKGCFRATWARGQRRGGRPPGGGGSSRRGQGTRAGGRSGPRALPSLRAGPRHSKRSLAGPGGFADLP